MDLNNLAAKLLARDFDNEYIAMTHANRVKFTFPQPVAWALDGEFGGEKQEIEIVVRPKALKLKL